MDERDRNAILVEGFALDTNGTLQVTIDKMSTGDPAYFLLYSAGQWSDLRSVFVPGSFSTCTQPALMRYEVTGPGPYTMKFRAAWLDQYILAVHMCQPGTSIWAQGSLELMNPGGQHLSAEEISFVPVFSFMFAVHSVVTISWGSVFCLHRATTLPIQRLFTAALLMRVLELGVPVLYFRSYSRTGVPVRGLREAHQILSIFSGILFLAVLLLMAMGWSITRDSLSRRQRHLFWGAFLLYAGFAILYAMCQDPGLCGAYLLSFHIVKFLITFGIIVAMNANIERLRSQSLDSMWPPDHSDAYRKLKVFRVFRWAFFLYLILPIVLLFLELLILTWRSVAAMEFLRQLLTLSVILVIAVAFRPTAPHEPHSAVTDRRLGPSLTTTWPTETNALLDEDREGRLSTDSADEEDPQILPVLPVATSDPTVPIEFEMAERPHERSHERSLRTSSSMSRQRFASPSASDLVESLPPNTHDEMLFGSLRARPAAHR